MKGSMDRVHRGGPWTRSMKGSMDWVHEGVHGSGPQGWSMDLGSMFCIRPYLAKL